MTLNIEVEKCSYQFSILWNMFCYRYFCN